MKYYDNDGKSCTYTPTSLVDGTGAFGSIYRIMEDPTKCIKILRKRDGSEHLSVFDDCLTVINEDIFNYFKYFDDPCFCKLYDLLHSKKGDIVGYTMKYYHKAVEDILTMPTEYILDNFNDLYDAMDKLAKDLVLAVDLTYKNMVLTKDKIVVVDFDKYRRSDMPYNDLLCVNTETLYYAFIRMFNSAFQNSMYADSVNTADNKLMVADMFSTGTDPLVLKRRFGNYERPIDMFLD